MKTTHRRIALSAFTLQELLVVIAVVAIVIVLIAGISLPCFSCIHEKGFQIKALSNAKQIALAMRLYADDNGGNYPSFTLHDGKPSTTPVADSNAAFAQLFPTYIQQKAIFWQAKSAFCSVNPPNEQQDPTGAFPPVLTLAQGENEWAYVLCLTGSSNPNLPVIAGGFTDPVSHTYSSDPCKRAAYGRG